MPMGARLFVRLLNYGYMLRYLIETRQINGFNTLFSVMKHDKTASNILLCSTIK